MNTHQTAVAAEAFAAGIFAQAGHNVFVQYGANQPGYDLLVSNNNKSLHVSVKGSTNGGWLLTTKKADGTYEGALEKWILKNRDFLFCFVQFNSVQVGQLPRIYLAFGDEIENHLKTAYFGDLALSLWEYYSPKKGPNKGKIQQVPKDWIASEARINEIFSRS